MSRWIDASSWPAPSATRMFSLLHTKIKQLRELVKEMQAAEEFESDSEDEDIKNL